MRSPDDMAEALLDKVLAAPRAGTRRLVALAGSPASGKTTLSHVLAARLSAAGHPALVVPMDGFHLDNRILIAKALLPRKGAPETFDAEGFHRLVAALPDAKTVYYPLFDRERDIAIAGAGEVTEDCDTVIVEGNYLLFDAPVWRDLRALWDYSIQLDVSLPVLRERLFARWIAHGLTPEEATARAEGNDLRNAKLVAAQSLPADITLST